jgi:UDP-N-acetylmuramate dehydrogenase
MSQFPNVQEHFGLSNFNTMGLAATARYFASVHSPTQIQELLSDARFKNLPILMLGGGSNVLFIEDFEGLIIHLAIKGKKVQDEDSETISLQVGAGENWHSLVQYCVEKGWGGIENLALIPGSVGAAPIQNIGAYGVELQEVFNYLEAYEIETGKTRRFNKVQCEFGYRDSVFKRELKGKYIITNVALSLRKKPEVNISYRALSEALDAKNIQSPDIKDVNQAVIEIRRSKLPDPAKIGNTGSFFKNPVITKKQFEELRVAHPDIPHYPAGERVKIPAAWLIEQCGWKGKRLGDAGVHKKQALVIVNYGDATGVEIWNLAQKIQLSVQQRFGISLMPEVNVVRAKGL